MRPNDSEPFPISANIMTAAECHKATGTRARRGGAFLLPADDDACTFRHWTIASVLLNKYKGFNELLINRTPLYTVLVFAAL